VFDWIVELNLQSERLRRQASECSQNLVCRHDGISLCRDHGNLSVQEFLLRIQHVQDRASADLLFSAYAAKSDLVRLFGCFVGLDSGLRRLKRFPCTGGLLLRLPVRNIDLLSCLIVQFL